MATSCVPRASARTLQKARNNRPAGARARTDFSHPAAERQGHGDAADRKHDAAAGFHEPRAAFPGRQGIGIATQYRRRLRQGIQELTHRGRRLEPEKHRNSEGQMGQPPADGACGPHHEQRPKHHRRLRGGTDLQAGNNPHRRCGIARLPPHFSGQAQHAGGAVRFVVSLDVHDRPGMESGDQPAHRGIVGRHQPCIRIGTERTQCQTDGGGNGPADFSAHGLAVRIESPAYPLPTNEKNTAR